MSGIRVNYREGKKELQSIPKRGRAMDLCATLNSKYLCCGVHVLRSVLNCPFECSYCFLQNYLTDGTTKTVNDITELMREVEDRISKEHRRLFRIGTWKLGDSLALEKSTMQASKLVQKFSSLTNAVLELKTKSASVDSLLSIDHNGKTVMSWSLNTDYIINTEEHGTASLEDRIHSMYKASKAGYLIGLHFDPVIFHDEWETKYSSLIKKVFAAVPAERIAWISMGSLRFNPEMKKILENNYPHSRLTRVEMVTGDDAKVRYVKPLRVKMYKFIFGEIKRHITRSNLVYLCMERWDMWDKVFGCHPHSIGHLDYLFAESLFERYGLGLTKPRIELYEK